MQTQKDDQEDDKTQENENARAIFETRDCTLIMHQEGGAASAISTQFACNSARYRGNLGPP